MGTVTRLVLLALATALVIAATCFALICRERECIDEWQEEAKRIFQGPPPVVIPAEPTVEPTAEPLPGDPVDPATDSAAAPMASDGYYERLADLKRRFAEGATIQRVSRPAPRRLGPAPTGEPDPATPGVQHLVRWKLYLEGLPEGFLGDPALDPLHPDHQ